LNCLIDNWPARISIQQEGKNYLAAMACGANYAWANRQLLIASDGAEIFEKTLKMAPRELGMRLVYDVCQQHCQDRRI